MRGLPHGGARYVVTDPRGYRGCGNKVVKFYEGVHHEVLNNEAYPVNWRFNCEDQWSGSLLGE
ncbi:MAG: hypothetical protein L7H10_04550 [Vulcanisaeta sp.]|nr:hypothetical protein [Vulcanisaeta sp.]MCG2870007.1 hypothetical protein [Vulcanisaeta sp.]MCG2879912.1 hypothetical protein [Vulcanisaeta sp.]MCG2886634.1 hypothetical protein [Vulcanisaeta sp.]MCG2895374.1 hypothetical protein [Vulcanisaeta sp.]